MDAPCWPKTLQRNLQVPIAQHPTCTPNLGTQPGHVFPSGAIVGVFCDQAETEQMCLYNSASAPTIGTHPHLSDSPDLLLPDSGPGLVNFRVKHHFKRGPHPAGHRLMLIPASYLKDEIGAVSLVFPEVGQGTDTSTPSESAGCDGDVASTW